MNEPLVIIIDDDPSARRGLTRLLRTAGMSTVSFASAADFLASGKCDGPGCIVLDVRMPEMTGPELQEELAKADYAMPIIFLSAHGNVSVTAEAMKKGAVDFLTKPVDRDDLLGAVRAALASDSENRNQRTERSAIQELVNTLTPREYEILTYVIAGMPNKQVAAELDIALDTVKIHRGRVMQKLDVVSVAELVRLCEKSGIAPARPRRP
jgi:FixJ family two-component response regulator